MKVISNWKDAPKMFSNWGAALVAVVAIIQSEWNEVFSLFVHPEYQPLVYAVLGVLSIVGRMIDQGLRPNNPAEIEE